MLGNTKINEKLRNLVTNDRPDIPYLERLPTDLLRLDYFESDEEYNEE